MASNVIPFPQPLVKRQLVAANDNHLPIPPAQAQARRAA